MKNLIGSLLIVFLCLQTEAIAQLSLGFKTGASQAWGHDVEGVKINGISLGGIVQFNFSKHIAIGFEPNYVRRGGLRIIRFPRYSGHYDIRGNYFSLPVFLTLNLPLTQKLSIYGKGGFGFSYLSSAQFEDQRDPALSGSGNHIAFETFYKWDHGMYAGSGILYKIGKLQWFLEGNYYWGRDNIAPNNFSRHRNICLYTGLLFSLNKN